MKLGSWTRRVLAVILAGSWFALRGALAFAQSYPGGGATPPDVGGETFFPPDKIPRTGSDLLLFLLIALILVVVGAALRIARRAADRDD